MAARTNQPLHDEQTKRKIQASQLWNRLYLYANGKIKMSSGQVAAARVILGKSIPDLKSIEHIGKDGGPIEHTVKVEFVDPTDG